MDALWKSRCDGYLSVPRQVMGPWLVVKGDERGKSWLRATDRGQRRTEAEGGTVGPTETKVAACARGQQMGCVNRLWPVPRLFLCPTTDLSRRGGGSHRSLASLREQPQRTHTEPPIHSLVIVMIQPSLTTQVRSNFIMYPRIFVAVIPSLSIQILIISNSGYRYF
jgi:hypothetical protein